MPSIVAPQQQFTTQPDRMIMVIDDLSYQDAYRLALDSVWNARTTMPRVTGRTTRRLEPIYGERFFGIYFPDSYVWFMEHGTKPFTMRSLAGKTIPMWVDDSGAVERTKNPKIKTRVTEDGRTQVLIFRKASPIGMRKTIKEKSKYSDAVYTRQVPASYPGAPGRIVSRIPGMPNTPIGPYQGGQIAAGNVGVRWRHPGLKSMQYLNSAIAQAAFMAGMLIETVYVLDSITWQYLTRRRR